MDKRVAITIKIDADLANKIKDVAFEEHRSLTGQVVFFLKRAVSLLNDSSTVKVVK